MRVLLDSHILLWWTVDPDKLRPLEFQTITDNASDVHVSAATVWELAIKQSLGRLDLREDFFDMLERNDFIALPITIEHALAVRELPLIHRDPFDRLLAAQARTENLTLITRDARLAQYDLRVLGDGKP